MKIYIAIFNKKSIINKKNYTHIQLNSNINSTDDVLIKDNSGDNISAKNPNYCELTGLYWIWKNSKEKIVGLVHYRRFFYKNSIIFNKKNVLSEENIEKILEKYDFIVPQAGYLIGSNIEKQYKEAHDINDLYKCGDVIKTIYPDYYDTFNKVINSNHYVPYNMFISEKKLIDNYCNWLFTILNEVEKSVDLDSKTSYNKRVFGFLSERLFNVWLIKNNFKVKQCPVYNVEIPLYKQILVSIIKKIYKVVTFNEKI